MASTALAKAEAKIESLKKRAHSISVEYEEQIEQTVGAMVGLGAAAAYGAIEEKYGEDAIFGTSVPLVAGLALTAVGISGMGGGANTAILEAGKAGLYIEAYKGGSRVARDWLSRDESSE